MKKLMYLCTLILIIFMGVDMAAANNQDKEELIPIYDAAKGKIELVPKIYKTDSQWKKMLTNKQYTVTRKKGTERAFTCRYEKPQVNGVYKCGCCGTDLFSAQTKYDSGTGWPSFWVPIAQENVKLKEDKSLGMRRIEVLCSRCDAHLGHLFYDGPAPTYEHYCINSVALVFVEGNFSPALSKALFAAGCFWGVEEAFSALEGVVATRAGYTGGTTKNPTYEDVCLSGTGHAEAVEIEFNPEKISYEKLLDVFWSIHDPTTLDRQGSDRGAQYRSVIFFYNEEQENLAKLSKNKLALSGKYRRPIVTQFVSASEFYAAEEYHQQYLKKHGSSGPSCGIKNK